MASRVFHTVGSEKFKAIIQRTHRCDSMATFSKVTTLLSASHLRKQHKQNTLLLFHGNNGHEKAPIYYVTRTLPGLLRSYSQYCSDVSIWVLMPSRFGSNERAKTLKTTE